MWSRLLYMAVALSFVFGAPAKSRAQDHLEQTCFLGFPDRIQARLEIRDRQLRNLLPGDVGGVGPEYVVTHGKTWYPGQTLKIAFNGGSPELRKRIAEAASEWTRHANILFDFGQDPQGEKYREWTTQDEDYAAEIRIAFNYAGYWSLVGTDGHNPAVIDANEPSMNFGGFHLQLPSDWRATVLHEFGHALGFQHEHQHPDEGCDKEFRWDDDPGYNPTTDSFGQYIADGNGKRPGIYTVLGGPPNEWPQSRVDHNLRQLTDSHAYEVSSFDRDSIMKYYFPDWMFVGGATSRCYTGTRNATLSPGDIAGVKRAYPRSEPDVASLMVRQERIFSQVASIEGLPDLEKRLFQGRLDAIRKEGVTLKAAKIIFDTPDGDDKDDDTVVNVRLYARENNEFDRLIAQKRNFAGDTVFADPSTHEYELDVLGIVKRSDVDAIRVVIEIQPNGNDTWIFNYRVRLDFSDGYVLEKGADGIRLKEDDRRKEQTF